MLFKQFSSIFGGCINRYVHAHKDYLTQSFVDFRTILVVVLPVQVVKSPISLVFSAFSTDYPRFEPNSPKMRALRAILSQSRADFSLFWSTPGILYGFTYNLGTRGF